MLLAGCEQLAVNEKAPQPVIESELLRKNGNALIETGRQQEAVAVFDRLIALDPHNPLAYNGKAVAFDYSGNHLAAQDIYKTALSLSSNSPPKTIILIKNNLAMSLILNQQPEQAIKLLEPLVRANTENNPQNNIMRHNLALAYGVSGKYEKATKLNLQDMTPEQAKENIIFYKNYNARNITKLEHGTKLKTINKGKKITQNTGDIGFITSAAPPAATTGSTLPTKPEDTDDSGIISRFIGNPVIYDYPN